MTVNGQEREVAAVPTLCLLAGSEKICLLFLAGHSPEK